MRTMFDAVTPGNLPRSAVMVADYVDGLYENVAAIRARFPNALEVSIAVRWTDRAQVLDVENGDATPAQAVTWCTDTMSDVSNGDLTVYANADTMPAVRAAFKAAVVTLPQLFVADYDGVAELPAGYIAKQFASNAAYDTSVVADYWPGVDPVPAPPAPPVPVEDPVTPADAQMFVNALLAAPVVEAGDAAPAGRTVLEVLAYQDQHYHLLAQQNAALSAQVTALSAALAAVAKGEAATVEAAVAAALKVAGHTVA
jgi:hypothetical protein